MLLNVVRNASIEIGILLAELIAHTYTNLKLFDQMMKWAFSLIGALLMNIKVRNHINIISNTGAKKKGWELNG